MLAMVSSDNVTRIPSVIADPVRILTYPNPLLRKKADPVKEVTPQIRAIVLRMISTMLLAPGFGLAATQIGVMKRIITVNPGRILSDPDFHPLTMINPRIIRSSGEEADEEGCLSLPGVYAWMERPSLVEIEYTTMEGEPKTMVAEKYLARCLLHEMDHLDGVLFWDRMSRAQRSALKFRYFTGTRWLR